VDHPDDVLMGVYVLAVLAFAWIFRDLVQPFRSAKLWMGAGIVHFVVAQLIDFLRTEAFAAAESYSSWSPQLASRSGSLFSSCGTGIVRSRRNWKLATCGTTGGRGAGQLRLADRSEPSRASQLEGSGHLDSSRTCAVLMSKLR
jgi:hypothetical protein